MFTQDKLPYAFDALEPYIDAQTMEIHYTKHHAAYIKNLNDLLAGVQDYKDQDIQVLLRNLDKFPEDIRQKVANNAGGHYNHTLFWNMLTPNSKTQTPNSKVHALKEQFDKAALSHFGSGWVWITLKAGDLIIETTRNQDVPKNKIVLGLDVWEHAYYLKYQNRRAEYIAAWWNIVNWDFVSDRLT